MLYLGIRKHLNSLTELYYKKDYENTSTFPTKHKEVVS